MKNIIPENDDITPIRELDTVGLAKDSVYVQKIPGDFFINNFQAVIDAPIVVGTPINFYLLQRVQKI